MFPREENFVTSRGSKIFMVLQLLRELSFYTRKLSPKLGRLRGRKRGGCELGNREEIEREIKEGRRYFFWGGEGVRPTNALYERNENCPAISQL